jgi:hypothetical protein
MMLQLSNLTTTLYFLVATGEDVSIPVVFCIQKASLISALRIGQCRRGAPLSCCNAAKHGMGLLSLFANAAATD